MDDAAHLSVGEHSRSLAQVTPSLRASAVRSPAQANRSDETLSINAGVEVLDAYAGPYVRGRRVHKAVAPQIDADGATFRRKTRGRRP